MLNYENTIAVVGMHIRVPGAESLETYWENLRNGVESITFFSDDELKAVGVDVQTLNNPDYVKAAGKLDGIEFFDASFFDMTPKEAEILDPQHRVFMEGVWKALEHAAIDPQRYPGRIGLYGGVGFNGYLVHHILTNPDLLDSAGAWQLSLNNDKDFATTRIAYKFNLQGPAISINTACSTSLVATTLAAQSLLNYQCDTAIAGGCSIHLPQDQGYHFMTGGTLSPDGHCRPFDADAAGTIDGNGTASVVLKRYEDAVQDGDSIYAVIRGFAVNNDGSVKVGYTAPSVEGQADVILEALEMADISPDQISYVETHGTGTDLGDSVEITALAEAFKASQNKCVIGSVKSNIGHLDTAAGVAGMIKVILSLQHGVIPPTCHFKKPNPTLGLEKTPFWVNNKAIEWSVGTSGMDGNTPKTVSTDGDTGLIDHAVVAGSNDVIDTAGAENVAGSGSATGINGTAKSRLAGISSFGIGGTNAHVIVGQAPEIGHPQENPDWIVMPFSAKSVRALVDSIRQLRDHIQRNTSQSIADIAYTLQTGRSQFEYRVSFVLRSTDHASFAKQIETLVTKLESELSIIGINDISVQNSENGSKSGKKATPSAKNNEISSKINAKVPELAQIKDTLFTFSETQLNSATTNGAPDDLCQSARLWLNNNLPDWDAISPNRKRVAIPGHPLYKQRYWIEPKSLQHHNEISSTRSSDSKSVTKEPNLDQWFYLPGWRKSLPGKSRNVRGSKWIIVCDSSGLANSIAEQLSVAGADVRLIQDEKNQSTPPKKNYASISADTKKSELHTAIIDTTSVSDWDNYFKALDGFKPEYIIHTGLNQLDTDPSETLILAFDGLISLGQALGNSFFSDELELLLLSDGIMAFDNPEALHPQKCTALGPLRVMAQEYPNISTRAIDIDSNIRFATLFDEITADHHALNVVLRGAQRWEQYFEPVTLNTEHNQSRIKENGLYLITGGLGDIGLTLAKQISASHKVHFALLSRSEFPDRKSWAKTLQNPSTPDRLKRQIQSIQQLESSGSTVQLFSADVSDESTMKNIIEELETKFKRIDGVIHAAGIVGQHSFVTLNDARTPDGKNLNRAQFPSKVDGTDVLGRILRDKSFDFCMICSSLSPILGGLGFSAYAATNLYADALVEKLNLHQPGKWISINWEGWVFEHDIVPGESSTSSALELGMTPDEGTHIFSKIINSRNIDRIVISSGNLQKRITQWVEKQSSTPESDDLPSPSHQRPIHLGVYTAPNSETEKQLVQLWGKLLGIDGIGVDDSFFELGGNSLLLTQLVAMIRKTFRTELALSAMFEHPTIAEIAKNIDQSLNSSVESEDRDEGFI